MAKSENNEVMFGARGRVGNLVVFKNFGTNQTVISTRRRKVENPVYTQKQEATKDKFREAVVYAKGIRDNQDLLSIYQKYAKPGTSAYNLALADFCKAPEIKAIDYGAYKGSIGNQIRIRAIDNFKVISVNLYIYNLAGVLIESGFATISANSLDWHYHVTVPNGILQGTIIKAEAIDRPGNVTIAEVIIA